MGSCKTYDQKPLDDGKGLAVGSVHGVVGLKFSSLINSDLTWKKVAKGSRSSSRRARNSLCKSWIAGEELLKLNPKPVASPFSESEKLGVSVLGCHFSDNADNVPVKKRKYTKRSKGNKKPLKNRLESITETSFPSDLGKVVDTQQEVDGKTSKMVGELDVREDFSGILILADAACNDGFQGGDYHVEGVSDECCAEEDPSMKNQLHPLANRKVTEECSSAKSSIQESGDGISVKLADDFTASPRLHNNVCSTFGENDVLDKSIADCSVVVSEDLLTKKAEERDCFCEFPPKHDRSYWDLNAPMDAWGCPLDQPNVDSNIADRISKEVKCGHYIDEIGSSGIETIQQVPHDSIDTEIRLLPANPGAIAHYGNSSEKKELNLDSLTDIDRTSCSYEKLCSSGYVDFVSTDSATTSNDLYKSASAESSTVCSAETTRRISLNQVTGSNSCVDNPFPSKSIQSLSSCTSNAICDTAAAGVIGITSAKNEDGGEASTCETVSSSLLVGEELAHRATLLLGNICEAEEVEIEDAKDAKESSLFQSTDAGSFSCSPIGIEKSTLGMITRDSIVKNSNVENDETDNVLDKGSEKPVTEFPEVHTTLLHASSDALQNDSKHVVIPFNEIAAEEPYGNSNYSDVSHDLHAYVKAMKLQLDNDSQYEDGEVRESIEYNWQECDGADIAAERGVYETDTANFGSTSEQNTTTMDFQTHSGMLEGEVANSMVDTGANIHIKPNVGVDKEIIGGIYSSGMDNAMIGAGNDSGWKNIHCETGPLGSIDRTRMEESRSFKRDSCSRTGEQSQSLRDISFRQDRRRFMQHLHARAQGIDRYVDSRDTSRGIKRHYSPRYDGSMSSHRPGPPKVMHRRLRSVSPDDRDEDLGTRMHTRPTRNLSPGWRVTLGRGRSIRYGLQGQGRGPVSRYHGVVTDDWDDSSVNYLHPSAKRERSYSPVKRRREDRDPRAHRSPSKSSSRSRSHSSSTENPHFGCRSRSPNFGSAGRTQRMRSPNQKPRVFVDRTEGYRPAPRNQGSPPHNRRWITDKKDSGINFRDSSYNKQSAFLARRPQGRFVQQDDRFDLNDSPRNYRPMLPRRFTETGGGGGLRYQVNDDDRGRRRFRYSPPQRVKRYNMDEPVKQRFHLDNNIDGYSYDSRYRDVVEFCDRRNNSKFNGIDRQNSDVSRKFRGYQREEKYSADKTPTLMTFGVQEVDNEMASRSP
ncbi:dentin sialophosphoprotein-related [Euphorbia peplus]|nr:dentin sialophosphoprotein-related [Euphorbia peplus]